MIQNQYTNSSCSTTVGFGSVCIRELSELIKKAATGMMAAQNGMYQIALMDDAIYSYAAYFMPRIGSAAPILVKNAETGGKYAQQSGSISTRQKLFGPCCSG